MSASEDGTMILWDIESGSRVQTFSGDHRRLWCVEFTVRHPALSSWRTLPLLLGRHDHFWILRYDQGLVRLERRMFDDFAGTQKSRVCTSV